MNEKLIWILLITILAGCAQVKYYNNPHVMYTPNGIAVSDSLVCDQTEITNFSWLEYRFWLKKTFGPNSQEYHSSAPDSTLWDTIPCQQTYGRLYPTHPVYREYPAIGISQEQAKRYSQWRSDRVFENVLVKKGLLPAYRKHDSLNYFTIEDYFTGMYFYLDTSQLFSQRIQAIPDSMMPYPVFHLPDSLARAVVLDYVDVSDQYYHQKKSKRYAKWREKNVPFILAKEFCDDYLLRSANSNWLDPKNNYLLIYNSRGNVAEWSSEENITYGGGWPHNVRYIMSKDTVSCTTPNPWTGFRNVCVWKKWEYPDN